MQQTILLVDYENIHHIDLSLIEDEEIEIKIFVGQAQNKIPFGLVETAQKFGTRIEWIKIDGAGNNALDFHIAFYLGKLSLESEVKFLILSKDKGYDPLIKHVNKSQIGCQRIQSLWELFPEKFDGVQNAELITEVVEKVAKVQKNKRPRAKKTLHQYLKSLLNKKKLSDREINTLIETLFMQDRISAGANRLVYNF